MVMRGAMRVGAWNRLASKASLAIATMAVGLTIAPMAIVATGASAAGDANQSSCANEATAGFRSYLPDCRAYELVSPAYKQGFSVSPHGYSIGDTFGGAPLLRLESFGSFAGGPSINNEPNPYLSLRSPSGWQTHAVDPQLSQYLLAEVTSGELGAGALAVTADGEALLALRTSEESIYASTLFRRALDGSLTPIGPMLPGSAFPTQPSGENSGFNGLEFAGASADLSRDLFYITAKLPQGQPVGIATNLWPGDTTVPEGRSLYEYSSPDAQAPAMVGVDDGGHLISRCGTSLGGAGNRNTHNAIAAEGREVVFTALACAEAAGEPPVNELYARIEQTDSAKRTVSLSEPSQTDCQTCDRSAPQSANFEGASDDGTRIFFTTEQALLPADRDSTTDLYEYDSTAPAGDRIVQVSRGGVGDASPGGGAEVQGVAAISDDGESVYFVAHGVLTTDPDSSLSAADHTPSAGAENLYVHEPDPTDPGQFQTKFVATLQPSDAGQWSVSGGEPMNVTPDGHYLLFTSSAPELVPGDHAPQQQVFRYDAATQRLDRISVGDQGFNQDGNGEANLAFIERTSLQFSQGDGTDLHPSISDDGQIVVFDSAAALTPLAVEAPNFAFNVYEYRDGRVYLISDGQTTLGSSSQFFGALVTGVSPDGADVFFRTYGALLPADGDTLADEYDARIAGGFSDAEAAACSGGCEDPEASHSTTPSLASLLASPVENVRVGKSLPKSKTPPESRAKRLAAALKLCRREPAKRRKHCESQARARYGGHVPHKQTAHKTHGTRVKGKR